MSVWPQTIFIPAEVKDVLHHRFDALKDFGSGINELFEDSVSDFVQLKRGMERLENALNLDNRFVVQNDAEAELLAECIEGGTYFAAYGRGPLPHAVQIKKEAMERMAATLSMLMGRKVVVASN